MEVRTSLSGAGAVAGMATAKGAVHCALSAIRKSRRASIKSISADAAACQFADCQAVRIMQLNTRVRLPVMRRDSANSQVCHLV